MKVGETLLLSNNTCVIIEEINVEKLSKPESTYNFEVVDYHTYYVAESKVLVHNTCVKDLKADSSISRDIQGEGKYGSYEITYESGNKYIGKGGQDRMWQSAARNANRYGDTVKSVKWRPSQLATNKSAFMQEAMWMKDAGWVGRGTEGFYNLINSPGLKYL